MAGSTSATARLTAIGLPITVLVGILAMLELLQRGGLLTSIVPAPSEVLGEIVRNPALAINNLLPSASKALTGYAVAAVITIAAGSLGVVVRVFYGTIYNAGAIINSIPVIATAPLLALWLGAGPTLHVVIAALTSQFPMLVGTMQGLRAADERQKELLHILSASRAQTLRYLLIPSALPYLFAGFKIAAPAAVLGTVTAEWAGADNGVGAMMLYALFSFDIVKVWLAVLLTCCLAAGSYAMWALIERKVIFWQKSEEVAT